MRRVGSFDEKERAEVFNDYLCVQGFESELRAKMEDAEWVVWVLESKHLPQAKEWFELYVENPDAEQFQGVDTLAQKKRKKEQKEEEDFHKKVHDREALFGGSELGPLTIFLIGVCVLIAFLSKFGEDRTILNYLFITRTEIVGNYVRWHRGLPDIFHDFQVWRLVTPMFVHFGIMHLVFNMLWLKDLGSMVEKHQKTWFLGALVLIIAVTSNLAQFAVSGPNFGGMSGVVYGLLGYVWLRGRFDPQSRLQIRQGTVVMMLIWFFICLSGAIGHIANTAHAVGLGMGMSWGYLSALWAKRERQM